MIMRFRDELLAGDRIVISSPADNDDSDSNNDFIFQDRAKQSV